MIGATHIHPTHTGRQCRRCGITITYARVYRYQNTRRDCAPILRIKRAA